MFDLIFHSISFYFVTIVIAILVYQYFQVLKISRKKDDYGKVKVITLLVGSFVLLLGISSIFADAIFELLGLNKPQAFEIMSLIAFTILCLFSYLIMNIQTQRLNQNKQKIKSVFDQQRIIQNDIRQNNVYKSSVSEKVLEYLGLGTIMRRFDIDINLKKSPPKVELERHETGMLDNTNEILNSPNVALNDSMENIETKELQLEENLPLIDIDHEKGSFDIDINIDNPLEGIE